MPKRRVSLHTILLLTLAVAVPAHSQSAAEGVAACIRSARCDRVFVVAHRARGFGGPENSREAIRNAIAAGHPVIEVDLRRTRDGAVVVFHNRLLDFVTSGHGSVAGATLDELRRARLTNGETIPRFVEVYELTRGRAVLWLHFKDDVVAEIAGWLGDHGSFDDAIFFLDRWELVQAAGPVKRLHPAMLVMTRAYTRADLQHATERLGVLPDLIHVSTDDRAEVSWFRQRGVKVAVKVLQLERLWPHQREQRRLQALGSGAQLVLADEPRFFTDPAALR
jgi:hypothetical protein